MTKIKSYNIILNNVDMIRNIPNIVDFTDNSHKINVNTKNIKKYSVFARKQLRFR